MKESFFSWKQDLRGHEFYSKRTNQFIPLYQLYWAGYSTAKVFEKFNKKERQNEPETEKY